MPMPSPSAPGGLPRPQPPVSESTTRPHSDPSSVGLVSSADGGFADGGDEPDEESADVEADADADADAAVAGEEEDAAVAEAEVAAAMAAAAAAEAAETVAVLVLEAAEAELAAEDFAAAGDDRPLSPLARSWPMRTARWTSMVAGCARLARR